MHIEVIHKGQSTGYNVQWNPSNKDTIGTLLSVPNRGVSLIQGLYCICSYVVGTTESDVVLYTEVSVIQGVLYSRVSFKWGSTVHVYRTLYTHFKAVLQFSSYSIIIISCTVIIITMSFHAE